MRNKPWLRLKSWAYSNGKTVNSVRDSSWFDPFKQINIFNQPTWYAHILIKTPNDLINLLKDIYNYHLYYNSYAEYMQQLELYKQTLEINESWISTYKKARNLPKPQNFLEKLKIDIKILFWTIPICNLFDEQIKREIDYIENTYLPKRKLFTDLFWDDLILDFFNYISLDEAQIYFWSRSWEKNFSWKNEFLKEFIAYPVKLNCLLEPIVQSTMMLDVNFRRQASVYVDHKSFFLQLIQKTSVVEVKDTEKVNIADSEVLSKSYRLNLFKIFGWPKVQYYRKHLIKPTDPDIYKPWDYFRYIRKITDLKLKLENEKNNKKHNS